MINDVPTFMDALIRDVTQGLAIPAHILLYKMTTQEILAAQEFRCGRCRRRVDHFLMTVASQKRGGNIVPGFNLEFNGHGAWDSKWIRDRPIEHKSDIDKLVTEIGHIKPFAVWCSQVTPPERPVVRVDTRKHIPLGGRRVISLED